MSRVHARVTNPGNAGRPRLRHVKKRSVRRSEIEATSAVGIAGEIEHATGQRRVMEVAVGLHTAVQRDARVIDSGGEFHARHGEAAYSTVSRAAPLHLRVQRSSGRPARTVEPGRPASIRPESLSMRAMFAESRPRSGAAPAVGGDAVVAEHTFHAHRGGGIRPVLSGKRLVGDGHTQHAEHAVGAVGQRQSSSLSNRRSVMPARTQRFAAADLEAVSVAGLAFTHRHQSTGCERRRHRSIRVNRIRRPAG